MRKMSRDGMLEGMLKRRFFCIRSSESMTSGPYVVFVQSSKRIADLLKHPGVFLQALIINVWKT